MAKPPSSSETILALFCAIFSAPVLKIVTRCQRWHDHAHDSSRAALIHIKTIAAHRTLGAAHNAAPQSQGVAGGKHDEYFMPLTPLFGAGRAGPFRFGETIDTQMSFS
ncbi:MAG: hypothetical protein Tsb0019_02070 [Roseibium sp.]